MNNDKILMSQAAFDRYQKEYDKRVNIDRERIKEALVEARSQGDLSENAEYDAAREEQGKNESRILELKNILDHAVISDNFTYDNNIGKEITVKYLDLNKNYTFILCQSDHDADIFNKKISSESPLGKAVKDAMVGDIQTVATESGKEHKIEILKIK